MQWKSYPLSCFHVKLDLGIQDFDQWRSRVLRHREQNKLGAPFDSGVARQEIYNKTRLTFLCSAHSPETDTDHLLTKRWFVYYSGYRLASRTIFLQKQVELDILFKTCPQTLFYTPLTTFCFSFPRAPIPRGSDKLNIWSLKDRHPHAFRI